VVTKVSRQLKLPAVSAVLFLLIFSNHDTGLADLTFRKSVSEVNLVFYVSDLESQNVAALGASDFAVVDNGIVVRTFNSFGRPETSARKLVIVVDASESVGAGLNAELASVLRLMSQSEFREDELSIVVASGKQPKVVCEGNCSQVSPTLDGFAERGQGETPLFDGMVRAVTLSARSDPKSIRRFVVLFSDGNDTVSRNSAVDALSAAIEHSVQVYAVDLSQRKGTSSGTLTLQALAQATGGRYFRIQDGVDGLAIALREDSHTGYTVNYGVPARTGGFHSVRILPTRNPKLRFRCREGYFLKHEIQ
jgi:VWFA-related protein